MASNTVGSSGTYADLDAWSAARADSTDATETAVMQDELHSDGQTVDPFTNDPLVVIQGAVAQDGDPTTGARFSDGNASITFSSSNTRWEVNDLSVQLTSTSYYARLVVRETPGFMDDGITCKVQRCFYDGAGYADIGSCLLAANGRVFSGNQGHTLDIDVENCVVTGINAAGGNALVLSCTSGTFTLNVRGCTFDDIGGNAAAQLSATSASVSTCNLNMDGCLVNSTQTAIKSNTTGSLTFVSTDNIVNESSSDHSADFDTVTNVSASTTFNASGTPSSGEVSWTDSANNDYSLVDDANNEAIDKCSTATMPADDILGTTRDATPDAGAFEVVTAGGVTVDVPTDSVTVASPTPTVENNVVVAVPTSSATVEEPTPTVTTTEHVVVAVPTDTVTVDSPVPTVTTTESVTISVPTDTVTIDSPVPTVTTSDDITVSVPADTVTIDSPIPTVTTTEGVTIDVPTDTVTVGSPIPVVGVPVTIDVPTSTVTIGNPVPVVGAPVEILVPAPEEVVVVGPPPSISGSGTTSVITVIVVDRNIEFEEGGEMVITLDGPSATDPKVRVIAQFLQDDPHP